MLSPPEVTKIFRRMGHKLVAIMSTVSIIMSAIDMKCPKDVNKGMTYVKQTLPNAEILE